MLTEWDEFKWLDFDKVADALTHPRIVDGRNVARSRGVTPPWVEYRGIGRT